MIGIGGAVTRAPPMPIGETGEWKMKIGEEVVHSSRVNVPASTGWRRSLAIGMRLVHEAPEKRELGA